jgi:riboflavin kinase/FMN adenylyltransferase
LAAQVFIDRVLVQGLRTRYVLVGDDFRFGARRAGDYALLDAAGAVAGFDVARMQAYQVHGLRVSSSAVRAALGAGDMMRAAELLGRPYSISGHVLHGARLGRELGYRTLNLRFVHARPAAEGIFVVRTHGLASEPLLGVANFGRRPTVDASDRILLEVHCFDWPGALDADGGYGRLVRVELLHWLHAVRKYDSLDALRTGIARDETDARAWLAAQHPDPAPSMV